MEWKRLPEKEFTATTAGLLRVEKATDSAQPHLPWRRETALPLGNMCDNNVWIHSLTQGLAGASSTGGTGSH